jgi:hypothetical protein
MRSQRHDAQGLMRGNTLRSWRGEWAEKISCFSSRIRSNTSFNSVGASFKIVQQPYYLFSKPPRISNVHERSTKLPLRSSIILSVVVHMYSNSLIRQPKLDPGCTPM